MYHYKCTQPGCGETECQPLPNTRVWCKCTVRKRVKGDGTRSFHPEMVRMSASKQALAA